MLGASVANLIHADAHRVVTFFPDSRIDAELTSALCAIGWLRPALEIDFGMNYVPSEAMVALARGLRPRSITALRIKDCEFTTDGKDLSALRHLRATFSDPTSALTELDLSGNVLVSSDASASTSLFSYCVEAAAPRDLVQLLEASPSLTKVNLLGTGLSVAAAVQLVQIAAGRRMMLSGIGHDAHDADYGSNLAQGDGVLIASDLRLNRSLRRLKLENMRSAFALDLKKGRPFVKAAEVEGVTDTTAKGDRVVYRGRELVRPPGRVALGDPRPGHRLLRVCRCAPPPIERRSTPDMAGGGHSD